MGKIRTVILLFATLSIAALPAHAQPSSELSHVVRPGETLGQIAQHYGLSVYQLAALNGIGNAHLIYTWQRLSLPAGTTPVAAAPAASATHTVQPGETLGSIAALYGISLFELQLANNIFNAWIFPGDVLTILGKSADPYPANTVPDPPAPENADAAPIASGETHIVRSGDTLASIAALYGVDFFELLALNENYHGWIYPGEELLLPITSGASAPLVSDPSPDAEIAKPAASEYTHVVRPGETLGSIAGDYGVSLLDLQALNDFWGYLIYPGQELAIPAGGAPPQAVSAAPAQPETPRTETSPTPATNNRPDTHTVARGETLFSIAQKYNVPVELLMSANGIADPRRVHSGLVLRVSNLESASPPAQATGAGAAPPAPSATVSRERYTVLPGDYLSTIGSKFGMSWLAFAAINGISNPDTLRAGAELQVPTREEAARYGPVRPPRVDPGAQIGVGREIVVVLSTQTAYAYENGVLRRSAIISSGLPATPTVTGNFKIQRKLPSRHMIGPDYSLPGVPWVSYFYAGYAFHGTYWHNNFGTPMSHGCVNMTTADAKWFYDFAPVGTPVHVRY